MGRLRTLIHRGEPLVLVRGAGLAPLVALSGDAVQTVTLAAVFALTLSFSAAILLPLRYLMRQTERQYVLALTAAMVVCVIDQLLRGWWPLLDRGLGVYLSLLAMNTLLLDRLDHVVTDAWFKERAATDSVWATVARLLARSILSVWAVVVMVVAVRALAAHAGFLPAALLGFDGPRGLAFFLSPGGALVVLGLVLALIRALGGLEEADE